MNSIKIKPSHRGLLTAKAKKAGMSIAAFSNKVTVPGSKANTATKRQAQFAINARKWNH